MSDPSADFTADHARGDGHMPFAQVLLEHDAFLRALARGLLDADRAEDAVQDAYTSALTHPPRIDAASGTGAHRSATRSWLATVVQNHARNRLRSDARRAERERRVARAESAQDDVAERLRVQRRVLSAVESLREPYRTAVYLRFAEGLPPREIAQRTAAPVETVRSRVQRGLEMLRGDLDRDFGDRGSWCAALLPFAVPRAGAAATTVAVPTSAWLAIVFAAVAIPLVVWISLRNDVDALAALPVVAPWADVSARTAAHDALATEAGGREKLERRVALAALDAQGDSATVTAPGPAPRILRTRVVDAGGSPLPWIRVADSDPSDADGWIEAMRAGTFSAVTDTTGDAALRVLAREAYADGTQRITVDVPAAFELDGDLEEALHADFELAASDGHVVATSRAFADPFEPGRAYVRFASTPRTTLLERDGGAVWILSARSDDASRFARVRVHAARGRAAEPVALRFDDLHQVALHVASAGVDELGEVRIESTDPSFRARASEDPRVRIVSAEPGRDVEALVRARGHAPLRVPISETAEHLDVVLEPRRGHELVVQIESTNQRHGSELEVEFRHADAPLESRTLRAEFAGEGRAQLDASDLAPGSYTLTPRDDGPWAFEPASAIVTVPGPPVHFVRRDDVEPRTVFVGVRDARGERIDRARCAILVDRDGTGRRAAIAAQGLPSTRDIDASGSTDLAVLAGQRFWWLVEADGCASAYGDERDARVHDGRMELDVQLRPSWHCEMWIAGRSAAGTIAALDGVRVTTEAGRELAASLTDGRIVLDLPYDPGQLRIAAAGWRVTAWEGFANGRRRAELPVHRVLLEIDR